MSNDKKRDSHSEGQTTALLIMTDSSGSRNKIETCTCWTEHMALNLLCPFLSRG